MLNNNVGKGELSLRSRDVGLGSFPFCLAGRPLTMRREARASCFACIGRCEWQLLGLVAQLA